jgi:hypothetical protein
VVLCVTGDVFVGVRDVYLSVCMVLLSAGAVWVLCVLLLLFYVVIVNGVEYGILEVEQ